MCSAGQCVGTPTTNEGSYKNNHTYQADNSEYDDDLGVDLHTFDLRNYDPQTGRWIQRDPYDQYASGHVGMGNNPAALTDPSGGAEHK